MKGGLTPYLGTRRALVAIEVLHLLAVVLPGGVAVGQAPSRTGRISLEREAVTPQGSGEQDSEFTYLGHAAVTTAGSVFAAVADGPTPVIRKYDAAGRFARQVGRPGSGPGEYRGVENLALIGDTLLVVLDPGNRRIVLFDTLGAYRGSFRVAGGGFTPLKSLSVTSDRLIGVRTLLPARSRQGDGVASGFIRYRIDGTVVDTVPVPAELTAGVFAHRSLGPRWPFSNATLFAFLPDGGMAMARSTAYRVTVHPAIGPPMVLQREVRPVALDPREREEWQALMRLAPRGVPVPTIPQYKPFIRDLYADPTGRLWVSLYTQATREEYAPRPGVTPRLTMTMWDHNAYDVFGANGAYLGRVDLPPRSRLLAVRGSRIWVAEETENGGFVLVRFRLAFAEESR